MNEKVINAQWVIDRAKELGFGQVGIIKSRLFNELEPILMNRAESGELSGFEEECIDKRIDPNKTLESCKSIIVGIFPYYSHGDINGNLSLYSRGIDYHYVLKDIMGKLEECIKKEYSNAEILNFTDSGPLVDRHLAFQAGLGFWGKNGHLINSKYGSYIMIGYMLTNIEFDQYSSQLEKVHCMNCGKCIEMCPGKAIKGNYDINPLRCKSYLSQKKEELTEEEKEIMRKNSLVFGCDTCQEVCPHNKGIEVSSIASFVDNLVYNLDKEEIFQLSNKKFKKEYGNRAFAWRGRKQIEKNIKIIEGD